MSIHRRNHLSKRYHHKIAGFMKNGTHKWLDCRVFLRFSVSLIFVFLSSKVPAGEDISGKARVPDDAW